MKTQDQPDKKVYVYVPFPCLTIYKFQYFKNTVGEHNSGGQFLLYFGLCCSPTPSRQPLFETSEKKDEPGQMSPDREPPSPCLKHPCLGGFTRFGPLARKGVTTAFSLPSRKALLKPLLRTLLRTLLPINAHCKVAADVWEKDVWEIQAKSGSPGSCPLFLHFLGETPVQKMSGRSPGSPRHPSSRHPRSSDTARHLLRTLLRTFSTPVSRTLPRTLLRRARCCTTPLVCAKTWVQSQMPRDFGALTDLRLAPGCSLC